MLKFIQHVKDGQPNGMVLETANNTIALMVSAGLSINIGDGGFANTAELKCRFPMSRETYDIIVKNFGEITEGKIVPAELGINKIVTEESTTPFYEGQTPKQNPQTGEIMCHNGSPIYMRRKLSKDENAPDIILKVTEKIPGELRTNNIAASVGAKLSA